MPKFEKKYVHFMWDDELEGKTVFFADSLLDLKETVENNNCQFYEAVVTQANDGLRLKMADGQEPWAFCYYDPYYKLKLASEQGKIIQAKFSFSEGWVDMYGQNIDWEHAENFGYPLRIKPEDSKSEENLVSNRELAHWLAQGNGEYCMCRDGWLSVARRTEYLYEQDTEPVTEVKIRKWEDEEWHEPTREYMGLEGNK